MSEYKWCHGPYCHKSRTQDRVRGSKGSKVLRTRKIKQDAWNEKTFYKYFCSNSCYNDFANANIERIRLVAPRNEPLETPIEDPVREKHTHNYSFGEHTYYTTTIKKIDTSME